MRHELSLQGPCFRLRPVRLEDAPFIIELRSNPEHSRFLHPISPDVGAQERWLKDYFDRAGDYYFIVEQCRNGASEGTIAIYDVDPTQRCAEWGRWVLRPRSMAAVESALLAFRVAFEQLGLDMIYSRTVALNAKVVSFHESNGMATRAHLKQHFTLNGVKHDAVEHFMTRANWDQRQPALEATAARIGRLLSR